MHDTMPRDHLQDDHHPSLLRCCDVGQAGAGLSPRSPLQAPDSPGPLGTEGGPDKNAAFISYKRDMPEGRQLDQVQS